jgi:hypothetical protein
MKLDIQGRDAPVETRSSERVPLPMIRGQIIVHQVPSR